MTFLRQVGTFFLDTLESVVIGLSIWLVCYLFLFMPTKVMGSSMEPNFHSEDCVITDKISYRLSEPKRGDVVTIHAPEAAYCPPGTGCDFFKRIIGLPQETVQVRNGHFYINGEKLKEPYLPDGTVTQTGPFIEDRAVKLEEDEYFVAGDNRQHSADSRYFGPVPKENILGKAVFRWCPVDSMGVISSQ